MVTMTNFKIMQFYIWGSELTPTPEAMESEKWIRPNIVGAGANATGATSVNEALSDYMNKDTGPGRYAKLAGFELVQKFFETRLQTHKILSHNRTAASFAKAR